MNKLKGRRQQIEEIIITIIIVIKKG